MPAISVIVPMYNVEAFIGECIASLRNQTFSYFEAVCVDDGSTDGTLAAARAAAAGDTRFVFVQRENGGLSAARNTGRDAATGEYVCFLDSDDYYEPLTLEGLYMAASSYDLDVVDFSAHCVYETRQAFEQHEESYDHRTPIEGVLSGPELFTEYWRKREYTSPAWLHFVRRSLLVEADLRFCEGLLHEDELFTPMLYAHAKRAMFLDEQWYCHRIREGSIMTNPKTLEYVKSFWLIASVLHAWLLDHADEYDGAFLDAMAQDICYIRDAAFVDLQQLDAEQVAAFVETLDAQARIDFDLTARYASDQPEQRIQALKDSRTYKVGELAVALPRMIRDGVRNGTLKK